MRINGKALPYAMQPQAIGNGRLSTPRAPMWHRLDDIELARIGLRRHELAPMRKPEGRAA